MPEKHSVWKTTKMSPQKLVKFKTWFLARKFKFFLLEMVNVADLNFCFVEKWDFLGEFSTTVLVPGFHFHCTQFLDIWKETSFLFSHSRRSRCTGRRSWVDGHFNNSFGIYKERSILVSIVHKIAARGRLKCFELKMEFQIFFEKNLVIMINQSKH